MLRVSNCAMPPVHIIRNNFILSSRLIRRTRAIPCSSGVFSLTHCFNFPLAYVAPTTWLIAPMDV